MQPMHALALATTIGLAASPSLAQNGYSFTDAAGSGVKYAIATVKPQTACRELRERSSGGEVTIVTAEVIAVADGVPEHCRVSGVIAPEIRFEVNLPAAWNRRFYMIGNGGFAGERPDMPPRAASRAAALKNGFVMASNNTGHDAQSEPLGSFGVSYQKTVDYAFRGVHLTAQTAKSIAARYYERPVAYAYWDGCSTGGRQALISAQRFPQDFDGIIAGAPVLNFVDTTILGLWASKALDEAPMTREKLKVVSDALYGKCDKIDGLADGIIDDPRRCDFDPARDVTQCPAGQDGGACITPAQSAALKKIYGGVVSNGKPYFPGVPVGVEKEGTPLFGPPTPVTGWDRWLIAAAPAKPLQLAYPESFMRFIAFGKTDPAWDWKSFDFDKDPDRIVDARRLINATDPDLSAFRGRGGKLLMYFGWADPALTPYMAVDYYEKALAANGPETRDFFRFFTVPGMFHCRGGVGPDRFDALTAIVNWVENGTAPQSLTAAKMEQGQVKMSRPLCPYPQAARYKGTGSTDEAVNFICKDPN